MEERKITDLSNAELMRELVYCKKMKDFYYKRTDEVMKEFERRQEDGNV